MPLPTISQELVDTQGSLSRLHFSPADLVVRMAAKQPALFRLCMAFIDLDDDKTASGIFTAFHLFDAQDQCDNL